MTKYYDSTGILKNPIDIFDDDIHICEETLIILSKIMSDKTRLNSEREAARMFFEMVEQYPDRIKLERQTENTLELSAKWCPQSENEWTIVAGAAIAARGGVDVGFYSTSHIHRFIAKTAFGLNVRYPRRYKPAAYTGYKDVTMTDTELAAFYQELTSNTYGCLENEYLIIRDSSGEVIDKYRWDGVEYKPVKYKSLSNVRTGELKPRNVHQELAFDLLQNDSIPVKTIIGRMGTGKDILMISHALDMIIRRGKYSRLIWVRNNVEVKDSQHIGFLPGTEDEKIMPFARVLADHVGGQIELECLMTKGIIELQHLGYIRGRDIDDAIILCSEAENLTAEHAALLLGRVGKNSALWLDGDFKQVDDVVFENNNGLRAVIQSLKGHKRFGCVQLEKCERSEVAEMADLIK